MASAAKRRIVECPGCRRIMKAVTDVEVADSDHLYVMTASGGMLPDLVKVGRSKNPCQRALELQESQPYHICSPVAFAGRARVESLGDAFEWGGGLAGRPY